MTDTNTTADAVDDVEAPVEVADKPREPTPYEKKLRTENQSYRLRAKQAEAARDEAIAKATADADAKISKITNESRERLMRAELKAHAVKAGIVDLDALKLFDLSKVQMSDDGEVANAAEVIDAFKVAKPHFFGMASTSSTATAPKPAQTNGKIALQMSDDEFKAAMAKIDGFA